VATFTVQKWVGFALASGGALVVGMSRIVSGKHFASDVLWSLGMVWTLNWFFYWFVFRIPKLECKLAP
jgi:membrane-associated phospholipid phosphatase